MDCASNECSRSHKVKLRIERCWPCGEQCAKVVNGEPCSLSNRAVLPTLFCMIVAPGAVIECYWLPVIDPCLMHLRSCAGSVARLALVLVNCTCNLQLATSSSLRTHFTVHQPQSPQPVASHEHNNLDGQHNRDGHPSGGAKEKQKDANASRMP